MLKQRIRSKIGAQRRQLSAATVHQASMDAFGLVCTLTPFIHCHRVAFYLAHQGELDPAAMMQYCLSRQKHCYLPVLSKPSQPALKFVRMHQYSQLMKNRFGILEPAPPYTHCPLESIDIVFVPLVAFDLQGNRLGMGKGYYDRSLARLSKKPTLWGLAYEFQKFKRLPTHCNDIPLDGVITEKNCYFFHRNVVK